jgi:hypothetical protein
LIVELFKSIGVLQQALLLSPDLTLVRAALPLFPPVESIDRFIDRLIRSIEERSIVEFFELIGCLQASFIFVTIFGTGCCQVATVTAGCID